MMFKSAIMAFLIVSATAGLSLGGVIEDLEVRGISRGSIEKARMAIYEDTQYKGINASIYYCSLVATKKDLEKAIAITKRTKGKSGTPSHSTLERLDDSYATNEMEIKEQKKLYKSAFGKGLTSGMCKDTASLFARLEKYHDYLLYKSFIDIPDGKYPLPN